MRKELLSKIYELYDIDNTIVNRNVTKCIFSAMKEYDLSYIEKQYYVYDEDMFIYLISNYKKLCNFFDFFYSLKTDLKSMFIYLMKVKINNEKIIFNAYFCPGYSTDGGYKNHLGKTTTCKLKILGDLYKYLIANNIPCEIHSYYCDSYIENCDDSINSKWKDELFYNRSLFIDEGLKYFERKYLHFTSEMDAFKNDIDYSGTIDKEIIDNIPTKVYNSFFIANDVFYQKMGFDDMRIKDRNDKLATMYIKVSNYINTLNNGVYLPMENMYDREKIIATNNTCTMYLLQRLVIDSAR